MSSKRKQHIFRAPARTELFCGAPLSKLTAEYMPSGLLDREVWCRNCVKLYQIQLRALWASGKPLSEAVEELAREKSGN